MKSFEKILSGIGNLPTLPTVYASLSEAVSDPHTSNEQLAKIISADQASIFKILKIANSSFFGLRGRIDTISQAILFLGFNEIRNIVFALTIMNLFPRERHISSFKPIDFWAHSIATGIITRKIGAQIGIKNLESFFISGVLHDIGKLVFLEFAHKEYIQVIELVESKNCLIREAEKEVFNMDHARAGYLLAEKWKLPLSIQNAIYYHHNGYSNSDKDLASASVHTADIFARTLELGFPGDNLIPRPNNNVIEILNLPSGFLSSIAKPVKKDFEHLVEIMLTL
ncbi:MAG: HDOD domain-containing protein [Ignavibacteriales bacterium]|nr:MAG: HDOD domain-containing protein [Ignavibacteriales bacterium]